LDAVSGGKAVTQPTTTLPRNPFPWPTDTKSPIR
jgi:hypothetical protein